MRSSDVPLGARNASDLLRESNHRIANNLMTIATLLRYQSRQLVKFGPTFSVDEVRDVFSEVGQRIELVSRLHRRLAEPIAPETLNLSPYLNDVAETAIDFLSQPGEVELEPITGDMCPVRADQALLIGLTVGELVASGVRFIRRAGAGGRLALTCGLDESGMSIRLAVGGEGVSGAFDPGADGGIGLGVAKLLVAQLRATLTFDTDGPGFTALLVAPAGVDLAGLDPVGEA